MTGPLAVDVAIVRGAFRVEAAFDAVPGRTLALVGPNGAGKSSLLAAIAGLVPLESGTVRLGDRVLDRDGNEGQTAIHLPAEARRIGVVFQDFLLFPHLTVRDNVAFGRRVSGAAGGRGAGRPKARLEAEPWLERFDLVGLADRHPAQLSGGQAQRVALARALASEPELLLLDEPMAALDVEIRDEVRQELAAQLAAVPVATVVVTHDAADVRALADAVVVIEAGRVSQRGSLAELQAAPSTSYVRRLVR
ncbi:hypothetical protein BH11ACT3_BH11ACT3_20230 [soil metagenome]